MESVHFTVEEAEYLLPRLGMLLQQMQELKRQHDRHFAAVDELRDKMKSNGNIVKDELDRQQRALADAAGEINKLIGQVREMGCELKDIDEGLIDFRSVMDGREVYLCWKKGEDHIGWWHEIGSGFSS